MALTNLTGDLKQTSSETLACSTEFTGEVHNHLLVLLALNGFVAITAFLGNTLILVALYKETSLHAPSKLLFRNLATTDLCVGIIVEPLFVTYLGCIYPERTMEYLPLRICCVQYHRQYFVWCVFVYTDRHKRGQASCAVVRTQVQTSCNFKANISHCSCVLGSLNCRSNNITLGIDVSPCGMTALL